MLFVSFFRYKIRIKVNYNNIVIFVEFFDYFVVYVVFKIGGKVV